MGKHMVLFAAALFLSAVSVFITPCPLAAEETSGAEFVRVVVEAEKIPVEDDLQLRELFDNTTYYGIISSQEELDKLWSEQVSTNKPYTSRLGIGLPEPPKIDFGRNSVIWFSDRGADASFVESVLVAAYETDKTVFITFVAYHSDFVSKRLELWKVPLVGYRPEFDVLHKYE